MSVFAISDLTIARAGTDRPALDNFELTLNSGETVVLLGEDGCGKEELLHLLAGQPTGIAGGTLRAGDAEPVRTAKLARPLLPTAYLPSAVAQPLSPQTSASAQLVRVIARKRAIPRAEARAAFTRMLSRLDGAPPAGVFDVPTSALSRDTLAWGLFAAAFAQEPKLLLADHALTGLAPTQARLLVRALLAEQRRQGFAMIYAAMNTEVASWLEGRVLVLRHGKVVEDAPIAALAAAQSHTYTQTFFKAMNANVQSTARSTGRGQPVLQAFAVQTGRERDMRPGDGLTFELRRGASLALLGEEGSGRRALVRVLLGLERPKSGRVVLDAVDVGILAEKMLLRLRRRIAMIAGDDDVLDPRMTLWDTVSEPLRAHLKLPRDLVATYRDAALKRVGLASLPGEQPVAELSTFDKRRLQVARAIVSAPLLAVIDEPLRGLDAFAQSVMRDLLRNFRAQEGPAFLVVTSDFAVAQALCEEAMVMKDGTVIERGALTDLVRAPKEPQTKALIDASIGGLSPAAAQG
ncbi:MAG TPA: ATP-binding cassette domain-containing protein [Rhizomicrobium sp.]|jgi:ABC-type glutathione transport system ATPase component|nr:ATP-binding cassette domain-containing protein [Rhizomicrobium sp.]